MHRLVSATFVLVFAIALLTLAACGALETAGPSADKSTITAAPSTVTANGKATAAIAVTLRDPYGQPFKGKAKVAISASPCDHCTLNYATQGGQTTGTISSTLAQDAVLHFTVNGVASPDEATVHFVFDKLRPDIVVILTDDIGIDQWKLFGYGGPTPPATPSIDTIAQGGVKFRNMWSMPACSNGRAALFTGRYPLRTNVLTAIGNNDLANYMVNPNETTLPDLLRQRGYKSALFGKFHLALQGNDPYGYAMVHAFGFDYAEYWADETGDPPSIDTTAGGVPPPPQGTWSCGFVRDAAHGGADQGACYAADQSCQEMIKSGPEAPGRICRDAGGIFDPNQSCANPPPSYINFDTYSGYYVGPVVINNPNGSFEQLPSTDIRSRTYRTTEVVDAALDWIGKQPAGEPWMAVLSFATDHTPLMQPPSPLLPPLTPDSSNLDCTAGNVPAQRTLSNEMIEAMDSEIARFLVQAGLATRDAKGRLVYDPEKSNTYVVLVNDNGSLGTVVKPPFDPTRAKSTPYQTGVWVPGIVAGPNIAEPGRATDAMVNMVDFYQLIGDLAGIDAHQTVPRMLDSQSMLPYLEDPEQPEIRTSNFTEIGTNEHKDGAINGPCVYNTTTCTQIAPSSGVCHDNGGIWWGPNPDTSTGAPAAGLALCCDVAKWQHDHDGGAVVTNIYPKAAYATRNDDYKLVFNQYDSYDETTNACTETSSTELYRIDEKVKAPELDTAGAVIQPPFDTTDQQNYDALSADLDATLASQPACPWDVNLDGVVDQADVDQWSMFQQLSKGQSSWADVNQDGFTNTTDRDLIEQNFGACPVADAKTAAGRR